MRETSSRSSMRRTICVDLALHHRPDARHRSGGVVRQAQHVEPRPQRRQRIAQFVREDGDELVLAPVDVAQLLFLDAQALLRLAQLVDVGRGADPADALVRAGRRQDGFGAAQVPAVVARRPSAAGARRRRASGRAARAAMRRRWAARRRGGPSAASRRRRCRGRRGRGRCSSRRRRRRRRSRPAAAWRRRRRGSGARWLR